MTDLLNPYAARGKRTVEITVDFPGSALPSEQFANPKSMTLAQGMKAHDVVTLRYQVEMPDATRLLRTGSPVIVTWGTTNVNESRTWVGYVHTTTPRKTGNTSGTTEIVCVSPSMILKQAAQDTWINKPVMAVAADIIQRSGLDADLADHPLTDNVIQGGRTYWRVLRDLAKLTGYSLTTRETQVIMRPHKSFFDLYAARARVFSPGASIEMSAQNSEPDPVFLHTRLERPERGRVRPARRHDDLGRGPTLGDHAGVHHDHPVPADRRPPRQPGPPAIQHHQSRLRPDTGPATVQ